MKPYYQDDFATIYLGDCREILPRLDGEVATVITDPPYGVGYVSNLGSSQNLFGEIVGDERFDCGWLSGLRRIVRPSGGAPRSSLYVFANDDSLAATQAGVQAAGWGLNTLLVWDKQASPAGDLSSYAKRTEFIVFATNRKVKLNGSRDPNLISVPRVSPPHMVHPTEKPVDLMAYLVLKSTNPGELVLDPFMGSGPVLVASARLGRKCIGIEVEERYCEVAAKRLAQGTLDLA